MGSAVAGTVNTLIQQPGMAQQIGQAMPALATMAPAVAVAAAGIGIDYAAYKALVATADRAIGQVQGLSPEVAGAEAQANVRQLLANLQTSRVLGDELATLVTARSRLSAGTQGLRDVVAEPFLKDLGNATSLFAQGAEKLNQFLQNNPAVKEAGQGWLQTMVYASFGLLGLGFKGLAIGGELLKPDANDIKDRNPITYWNNNLHMPKLPAPFTETDQVPINFEKPSKGFVPEGLEL
jgi:hypothetical protein